MKRVLAAALAAAAVSFTLVATSVAPSAAAVAGRAPSVRAADSPPSVSPVLECSWKEESGGYRSLFGYSNKASTAVDVPIGDRNAFKSTPSPDAGQPTTFEPGRHVGVFVVAHKGTIVWALTGRTSTAPGKACANPPVPAAGGGIQGLLIIGLVSLALVGVTGWFAALRHRRRDMTQ